MLIEVNPKTIDKFRFCKASKDLLGGKAQDSNLKPMCPLEIQNHNCFAEDIEVEVTMGVEGATKYKRTRGIQ